jgi:hypothetical protein
MKRLVQKGEVTARKHIGSDGAKSVSYQWNPFWVTTALEDGSAFRHDECEVGITLKSGDSVTRSRLSQQLRDRERLPEDRDAIDVKVARLDQTIAGLSALVAPE